MRKIINFFKFNFIEEDDTRGYIDIRYVKINREDRINLSFINYNNNKIIGIK